MKGRFRKGKKASKKFDFWLEWFGIRNHSPMSSRQKRLLYRYIKFHNARLDAMIEETENEIKNELSQTKKGMEEMVG